MNSTIQNIPELLFQMGKNQIKNVVNWVSGNAVKFSPLNSVTIDEDDVNIARSWLNDTTKWNNKEIVQEYEDLFANWNGSNFAFSFMGGRVALSACIFALDLQPGDEVIIPGYTCVVVPNAFDYAGVKVVYSDIELDTYGLDIRALEKKISSRTKAIVIQHSYGLVNRDYEVILDYAHRNNLRVIEDCAHATGAKFKNINVGNYGDCAFYSSEQSKVFTTIQGGIATTNDPKIAEKLKKYQNSAQMSDEGLTRKLLYNVSINYLRNKHPYRWIVGDLYALRHYDKYLVSTTKEEEQGKKPEDYGRKMSAPLAALGINQIKKIDLYNSKRRETAKIWDKWCKEHGYSLPMVIPDSEPVYLRYPILVEPERKRHLGWARKNPGIQAGKWFVSHTHPTNRKVDGCPNADLAVERCINFPGVIQR